MQARKATRSYEIVKIKESAQLNQSCAVREASQCSPRSHPEEVEREGGSSACSPAGTEREAAKVSLRRKMTHGFDASDKWEA